MLSSSIVSLNKDAAFLSLLVQNLAALFQTQLCVLLHRVTCAASLALANVSRSVVAMPSSPVPFVDIPLLNRRKGMKETSLCDFLAAISGYLTVLWLHHFYCVFELLCAD